MSKQTLSIVIPVYKDARLLTKCLSALAVSRKNCEYENEIIVVDDCSPNHNEICDIAQSYSYRYLKLGKNAGPAKARNIGVNNSKGNILLFIDADVVVRNDCLQQVGDFFCEKRKIYSAMIGTYVKDIESEDFPSNYKNLVHHYTHQHSKCDTNNFWTGCGAVTKDAFLSVEGFDISYNDALIEDIEFGYRLKQKGHNIFINKRLQVRHLKKYNLKSLFISDFYHRAIPLTKLILKHKNLSNDQDTKLNALISTVIVFAFLPAIAILYYFGYLNYISVFLGGNILILAFLNKKMLLFFTKEKGMGFGLKSYMYLIFYYLYCGLGFMIGFFNHYQSIIIKKDND